MQKEALCHPFGTRQFLGSRGIFLIVSDFIVSILTSPSQIDLSTDSEEKDQQGFPPEAVSGGRFCNVDFVASLAIAQNTRFTPLSLNSLLSQNMQQIHLKLRKREEEEEKKFYNFSNSLLGEKAT